MKIFIINLPSSSDRRPFISNKMQSIGVDFEFFSAIDGRKGLPHDLINCPDDKHRIYFRSRPLSPGEKGCYASHYRLWQKCIELQKPIVILEDDCIPTSVFKKIYSKLPELHNKGYEYLRLQKQQGEFKIIEQDSDLNIVLWKENLIGTVGYSITPEGAKKLLIHSKKWRCPVDNFIGESYKTNLLCSGIQPYAIEHDYEQESTIQLTSEKSKVSIIYKSFREIYRSYRNIRMSLHYYIIKNNKN